MPLCFSTCCITTFLREKERDIPADVQRKRDADSRWKSEKALWDCSITHATVYFSMLCWFWVSQWMWWWLAVLALPQEEDHSHVCPVTLTKRTVPASGPGLVALQQESTANLRRPPPTPHPWNTTRLLRYLETPVKQCDVGPGLLFTSIPVLSATTAGVCQGPGKHNEAGRRNFPLTQEIGTSCATTQSNRLSYFTHCPAWHMLATQGHFVFRSTITHLQDGLEPILSTSSTGLTKADRCYV